MAQTEALYGTSAFGQWGGTEEPAAWLRSSCKWEHNAHVGNAVPAEQAGINYKRSATQEGQVSLGSWVV